MENQVTQLLKAMVKPDYTACSYAFMQNGKIVCADAIGVINKINNQPITTDCTFNVCSISKIYFDWVSSKTKNRITLHKYDQLFDNGIYFYGVWPLQPELSIQIKCKREQKKYRYV